MSGVVFETVLALHLLVFGGVFFKYSFPMAATSYYHQSISQSRKKVYPEFFKDGSSQLSWLLHLPSKSHKGNH
jgi:hypothetical protein